MTDDRLSIVERTESRGLVELSFPWVGGSVNLKFPATNRSIMVIAVSLMMAMTVILPTCCYIVFVQADAENIRSVNQMTRVGVKPEIPESLKKTNGPDKLAPIVP